jgi:hypothetical protein
MSFGMLGLAVWLVKFDGEFLHYTSDHQLLKNDSASCVQFIFHSCFFKSVRRKPNFSYCHNSQEISFVLQDKLSQQ